LALRLAFLLLGKLLKIDDGRRYFGQKTCEIETMLFTHDAGKSFLFKNIEVETCLDSTASQLLDVYQVFTRVTVGVKFSTREYAIMLDKRNRKEQTKSTSANQAVSANPKPVDTLENERIQRLARIAQNMSRNRSLLASVKAAIEDLRLGRVLTVEDLGREFLPAQKA
jgi:hypothetical protein